MPQREFWWPRAPWRCLRYPMSGHMVLALLCGINMVNYVDRMIVSGAPIQFGEFVSETLDVPAKHQAFWLGIITPAFMVTFSIASILFGHMVHHVQPFRLMAMGLSVWVLALATSGLCYYLPKVPATFWIFLTARAVSGVGEASFQCFVPAYVEDFAPEGSRALWLAILYSPIPVGSALGLGIGASFAPAPPQSVGWGVAYGFEALIMAPCACAVAWFPSAKEIRRRRRAALTKRRAAAVRRALAAATTPNPSSGTLPLLTEAAQEQPQPPHPDGRGSGSGSAPDAQTTPPPSPRRLLVAADEADAVAWVLTQSPARRNQLGHQHGDLGGAAVGAPEPPAPSVLAQIIFLITSPTYMCIALGYAGFTATTMGISTFAPLCLMALGLFDTQKGASNSFGLVCAIAGILGAPLGGRLTDFAVSVAVPLEASSTSSTTTPRLEAGGCGGSRVDAATGGDGRCSEDLGGGDIDSRAWLPSVETPLVTAKWRRTLREVRALVICITVMIAVASFLCISAIASLYGGRRHRVVFLALVAMYVALAFATSAGITRSVMLVVPTHVRPFALGFLTLILHALGDVPSPPIIGLFLGAWATNCSIIDVNRTTGTQVPHGGPGTKPIINPACFETGMLFNSTDWHLSEGQYGMMSVLMLAAGYMLTAVFWWGLAIIIVGRRLKTERRPPEPKACCTHAKTGPPDAMDVVVAADQLGSVNSRAS